MSKSKLNSSFISWMSWKYSGPRRKKACSKSYFKSLNFWWQINLTLIQGPENSWALVQQDNKYSFGQKKRPQLWADGLSSCSYFPPYSGMAAGNWRNFLYRKSAFFTSFCS